MQDHAKVNKRLDASAGYVSGFSGCCSGYHSSKSCPATLEHIFDYLRVQARSPALTRP